jgi:flagellin
MQLGAKLARLDATRSNVSNAISFAHTQDGYLQRVNAALDRMGELSVLALDVTKTDSDRGLYQQEFSSLGSFINTAGTKDFNGVSLFSAPNKYVTIDPEVQNSGFNTFTMVGVDLASATFAALTGDSIATVATAQTALTDVKSASGTLAYLLAQVGTNLETLTFYHDQLSILRDNLSAAKSRITDVEVAQESTTFAKLNILVQSGTAMLAQANALPQSVLKLLG